jgi:predicted hotdog family 3-hydroxylacyl-ACP dehydratase
MAGDQVRKNPALYVPHEGDAVLLDEVWQESTYRTHAKAVVRGPTPFSEQVGGWPSWMAIELMAQVVAASAGLREFRPGVQARLGLLLGVRSFVCARDFFPAGTRLQIEAIESNRDNSGMGVYDCGLAAEGEAMASGVLTVYLPESVDSYLESLEP